MKFFGSLLCGITMLMLGVPAYATNVEVCNDCDSISQHALQLARTKYGVGTQFHVMDFENELVQTYQVTTLSGGWGAPIKVAYTVTTPSGVRTSFNKVVAKKRDFRNATSDIDIPRDLADSAYDLAGSSSTQRRVGDHIWNDMLVAQKASSYIGAILSIAGKLVDVNITITVNFVDGSTATFEIDAIDSSGNIRFAYMGGGSIDAERNAVPDTRSAFAGEFRMNANRTLNEFVAAASRFGVDVVRSGQCDPSKRAIICVKENGSEICYIVKLC